MKLDLKDLSLAIKGAKECIGEYKKTHQEYIDECDKLLPSGSGTDGCIYINVSESDGAKIVINFEFHHMDESGSYVCWREYSATITPAFGGFELKIGGDKDEFGVYDYFHDLFMQCL